METKNTVTINDISYEINEPTFSQLNDLKEAGFDTSDGMTDAQIGSLIRSDYRVAAKWCAIILCKNKQERERLEELIYENCGFKVFRDIFSFFTQGLKGTSEPSGESVSQEVTTELLTEKTPD